MREILVIFDIDGTLSNTTGVDDECLEEVFKKRYNLDLKSVDWSDYPHATDWSICETILNVELKVEDVEKELKFVEDEFIQILSEKSKAEKHRFQAVENSVGFFNRLQNEGYALGLATGAWRRSAEVKLNAIGLDFASIPFANSNDHFSRSQITKTCINRASVLHDKNYRNEEIIYFGDGAWDLETTRQIGIDFIGVDCQSNGKLFELGQKEIITDYSDEEYVLELIEVLKNA